MFEKKTRFQGKIKTFNWSTSETGDWSKTGSEQKQNDSTMSNAFGTLHTHHGLKKARFQGKIKTFNWSTSETGSQKQLEVNKNKMIDV